MLIHKIGQLVIILGTSPLDNCPLHHNRIAQPDAISVYGNDVLEESTRRWAITIFILHRGRESELRILQLSN